MKRYVIFIWSTMNLDTETEWEPIPSASFNLNPSKKPV